MFKWLPEEESNRGMQVIAALMALTLWIFVALLPRMDMDKRRMTLPIKVHNASMAAQTNPLLAEVVMEGSKAAIARITEADLEVFVDLKQVDLKKTQTIPLTVSGPPGVHWEVSPTDVQVLLP